MSEPLPPGKDIPVPTADVVEVELALIKNPYSEDDRKWLDRTAIDIFELWAPGLLEAITALSPQAQFVRSISESERQNAQYVIRKASRLNLNLITTQARPLRIFAPDGRVREDAFVLSLYLKVDPRKKADLVVLVAANHRFVPESRTPLEN